VQLHSGHCGKRLPGLRCSASRATEGCPQEELDIRARLLSEGGPKLWAEFMRELRETRLGVKRRKRIGPSVGERLQAAYESVVARKPSARP
jgi:hypothetical protein